MVKIPHLNQQDNRNVLSNSLRAEYRDILELLDFSPIIVMGCEPITDYATYSKGTYNQYIMINFTEQYIWESKQLVSAFSSEEAKVFCGLAEQVICGKCIMSVLNSDNPNVNNPDYLIHLLNKNQNNIRQCAAKIDLEQFLNFIKDPNKLTDDKLKKVKTYCKYCEVNEANISKIFEAAKEGGVEVITSYLYKKYADQYSSLVSVPSPVKSPKQPEASPIAFDIEPITQSTEYVAKVSKQSNQEKIGIVSLKQSFAGRIEKQAVRKAAENVILQTHKSLKIQGITEQDINEFIDAMKPHIQNIKKGDVGKDAGFTAWKEDIKRNMQGSEKEKDNKIKTFAKISAQIQKDAHQYFGTDQNRKYKKDKDNVGARSFRVLQLLSENYQLKASGERQN